MNQLYGNILIQNEDLMHRNGIFQSTIVQLQWPGTQVNLLLRNWSVSNFEPHFQEGKQLFVVECNGFHNYLFN